MSASGVINRTLRGKSKRRGRTISLDGPSVDSTSPRPSSDPSGGTVLVSYQSGVVRCFTGSG